MLTQSRAKQPTTTQAWILASRPKTLTAAVAPVAVGIVLAASQGLLTSVPFAFCTILFAVFIQIGTNFVNDALDFKKGADSAARLGPLRATQQGWLNAQHVLIGAVVCFTLAFAISLPLILHVGYPMLLLAILSICLGYLYTGGPYPIAYAGLGEVFVFLFFGLISVPATFYIQTGYISSGSVLAGVQLGLLATLVIAINNFRDIQSDVKARKMTMAARFGNLFARIEITILAILPLLLGLMWLESYPLAASMPLLSTPIAVYIVQGIWSTEPGKHYNKYFGLSALLHLLVGTLLCAGMLVHS